LGSLFADAEIDGGSDSNWRSMAVLIDDGLSKLQVENN